MFAFVNRICYICVSKFIVMEDEERKITQVYAIVTLYTIVLLIVGTLLGFSIGRQSISSEREEIHITTPDTIQVK